MPELEKSVSPEDFEQEPQHVLDYRRLDAEMKLLFNAYGSKKDREAFRSGEKLWLKLNEAYEHMFNGNKSKISTQDVDGLIGESKREREFLEVIK